MTSHVPLVIAGILGFVAGVVSSGAMFAAAAWLPSHIENFLDWTLAFNKIGSALAAVIPGLIAGMLAQRKGIWAGGFAGLATAVIYAGVQVVALSMSGPARSTTLMQILIGGVSAAAAGFFTNALAGIAGVYIARTRFSGEK